MKRRPGKFRKFLQAFDLPLLRKDLTELAVRPRTYVVRVLYAVLLLSVSWWSMSLLVGKLDVLSPETILGSGKGMFRELMKFQIYGLLLLTPAMVCGSITIEKERNTLGLLFLTRLGPWGILFEKLLSRLVPIFTFLLLSMPLFAIAYSFGGVDTETMLGSIVLLFALAFQIAALSLLCSTYFRSTASAFIWSYVLQGLLMCTCGLPFVFGVLGQLVEVPAGGGRPFGGGSGPFGDLWSNVSLLLIYLTTAGFCGFWTIIFLVLSRVFLFRRAFLQPKQLVLKLFKKMDKVFLDLNERYTRGIVLMNESVELPDDRPIAWRETKKRSLGTVRYLFRVFVVIEIPLLFFCLLASIDPSMSESSGLSFCLYLAWILAVLILTMQSSGLIAAERSRETLNVLLTTTMTSREIILQKFAGVRRAINVLRVPLITVCVFELVIYGGVGFGTSTVQRFYPKWYLMCSALAILIYPVLVGWLGLLVSMYVKSQSRAVLTTLGILLAWCCLVPFTWGLLTSYSSLTAEPTYASRFVLLCSPASIVVMNEELRTNRDILGVPDDEADSSIPGVWPPGRQAGLRRWSSNEIQLRFLALVVCNFIGYGIITYGLRARCLSLAASKLGRNDGQQRIRFKESATEESAPVGQLAGMESKI